VSDSCEVFYEAMFVCHLYLKFPRYCGSLIFYVKVTAIHFTLFCLCPSLQQLRTVVNQRLRNGGSDGGARPRNVETTGREYLIAPAIFSHILFFCMLYPSTLCRYVAYIQLKRHTQLVLQVEYYETN